MEQQKKREEQYRKRGGDPIATPIPPPSGTPINIVQKPNGKLAAEVSKPVPLGGRKPKTVDCTKLRTYIKNKLK